MSAWNMLAIEFCFLPVFVVADFLSYPVILAIFSFLMCLFYFPMQQYVYAWYPVISSVISDNERGYFLGILRISLTFANYILLQISSKILGFDPEYIIFLCNRNDNSSFNIFPFMSFICETPRSEKEPSKQIGGVIFAGQLMGDTTRRMALAPQEKRSSYSAFMLVFGAQMPVVVASPVAGFLIQKYRYLRVGFYGIYQLVIFATIFLYAALLWQILRMRPLKEKPIIELLKNSLIESLMKLRDVIASPS